MTDKIRRYECLLPNHESVLRDTGCGFGEWVRYKDHLKAMEAKDKEIEQLKREKAALETAVIAQGMGL